MHLACGRICNSCRRNDVGFKIKGVAYDHIGGFSSIKSSDDLHMRRGCPFSRNDKCPCSRESVGNGIRRRGDVHLAVPGHDIAIAAKPLHTLVLVSVFVISVKKVTVAQNDVDYGVFISRLVCGRIPPEHIEYVSSIMEAPWNLAVTII